MASRDPATRSEIARLGGLARSAKHSPGAMLAKANTTYRDSFRKGHQCAMCPAVEIPQDLEPAEIERRAEALYRLHMRRLRLRQTRAKAKADEAREELQAIDDELATIASAS